MSRSWADELDDDYPPRSYVKIDAKEEANLLNKLKRAENEQKGVAVAAPSPAPQKTQLNESKTAQVVVQYADPNSPLHSAKSFEELGLSKELLRGIYEMNFEKPSKIQESALPIILSDPPTNLIAQAQSGTGKTAAFTLGMLHRCKKEQQEPQAICIAPTRELARQLFDNIHRMGRYTGLQVQLVVKDENMDGRCTSQVLVGTPGPFLDAIKKRAFDPKKIQVFVLDEADVLFAMTGMLNEQSVKLKKLLNPKCQSLLFSATFKPEVRDFAARIVPQPCAQISLKVDELTIDAIQQLYIKCTEGKYKVLSDLFSYLTVGQTIIFVGKRITAVDLTEQLRRDGHTVSYICGGQEMTPAERDQVIDEFRDAKIKVLITTNVLARGIDIQQVMLVINFDLPVEMDNGSADTENYLHRIGRSGRFGRKGIAINLVESNDDMRLIKQIEQHYKRTITDFPASKIDELQQMLEQSAGEDVERRSNT
ncbi:putative ATP-dependent RNA helicase DBP5 [Planoprotostelium fungivorum]|uniref:RNA helicase n=1 Tax=Planoprotostelium fungivorum TaxID=1890364 RepID=A0A2P6NVF1_9EUKA|nr:putative ATP-dependent RNA helicase DBP5 [Planoprotostelium fungivorum]